jgi:hypothetical protein
MLNRARIKRRLTHKYIEPGWGEIEETRWRSCLACLLQRAGFCSVSLGSVATLFYFIFGGHSDTNSCILYLNFCTVYFLVGYHGMELEMEFFCWLTRIIYQWDGEMTHIYAIRNGHPRALHFLRVGIGNVRS